MVLLKLMYLNICKGHGETSEGEKVKRIAYSRKGQGPQMVANEMRKRRSTQGESLGGGRAGMQVPGTLIQAKKRLTAFMLLY